VRAAILHGPGDVRIDEVPDPRPGPGEVVVRVLAALTGGTTAKVVRRGYHARMGKPPLPLGHEGAGVVEDVGRGVAAWKAGDVVVPANSASCGACARCTKGLTAQCERMTWLTGFFAERLLVPAPIVAGNLHRVPAGLAPEAAALAEPLATVLKGHDRTPARRGDRALVLGTGALGLLWVRVLSAGGAEVTAVGRRPERARLAEALGASRVETKVEGAGWDLVVEAVGTAEAWQTALRAAAPGGRVHLFGGPPSGTTVALDAQRLHYDELTVTASFHHTPYHFAEALRLLGAGFLDPALLVEERLALADLPAFLARPAGGPSPLKAAVVPGSQSGRPKRR
jgi:L-iditol 2-dehydrogenase